MKSSFPLEYSQLVKIRDKMLSAYLPKKGKSKNTPISDCLLSFDIETTSWDENYSSMYSWSLGAALYQDLIKCNNNDDLENVTESIFARTWVDFDSLLFWLDDVAKEKEARFIILVYNLDFEWSYLQKNIDFLAKCYVDKYPTVIEGNHNIMSIQAGNIIFLDAARLFGLGSLKQNAAKYGFKKLEYDYELKRHSGTKLSEEEIKYNMNDVLITLGSWAKVQFYAGVEHINSAALTQTGMIKNILKNNPSVNEEIQSYDYLNKSNGRYYKRKISIKAYKKAVDSASKVFPQDTYEEVIKLCEAAFSGGFSHANIFIQGKTLFNVASADLGSAYPGAMQANWYPRRLIKKEDELNTLRKILQELPDNYMELAKLTREHLPSFGVCTIVISNINVKVFETDKGKCTIPLISEHKLLDSKNAIFDNGKLVEAEMVKISCSTIDIITWRQVYDFKITNCEELYQGANIRNLPDYWLNAVDYCYSAKTILKNTIKKYKSNDDWKNEYRKLNGVGEAEIKHVESMESHEAGHYLDIVLLQRKAELNGLYGIMVMHVLRQSYQYNEDKSISKKPIEMRKVKDGTNYLWGIIVTSIVRLWEVCFSLFLINKNQLPLYWDTDSVKFLYDIEPDILVKEFNDYVGNMNNSHPALGAYDYEGSYKAFKTLGSKRYAVVELNEKTNKIECFTTIAGLPKLVFGKFLTGELDKYLKITDEKDAIEQTLYYFKPNIFVDESATNKLVPKYIVTENPVTIDCVDHFGNHKVETFWPGARLSGIRFALMDMRSRANRQYQQLCCKMQGCDNIDYQPLTIYKNKDKFLVMDGFIETDKLMTFVAQKDVYLYS